MFLGWQSPSCNPNSGPVLVSFLCSKMSLCQCNFWQVGYLLQFQKRVLPAGKLQGKFTMVSIVTGKFSNSNCHQVSGETSQIEKDTYVFKRTQRRQISERKIISIIKIYTRLQTQTYISERTFDHREFVKVVLMTVGSSKLREKGNPIEIKQFHQECSSQIAYYQHMK